MLQQGEHGVLKLKSQNTVLWNKCQGASSSHALVCIAHKQLLHVWLVLEVQLLHSWLLQGYCSSRSIWRALHSFCLLWSSCDPTPGHSPAHSWWPCRCPTRLPHQPGSALPPNFQTRGRAIAASSCLHDCCEICIGRVDAPTGSSKISAASQWAGVSSASERMTWTSWRGAPRHRCHSRRSGQWFHWDAPANGGRAPWSSSPSSGKAPMWEMWKHNNSELI